MNPLADTIYLHGLNLFPSFGPKRLGLLSNYFENFGQAFTASTGEIIAAGIDAELAEKFIKFRQSIDLEAEADKLDTLAIRLISAQDRQYPRLLLECGLPPALLYVRGTVPAADWAILSVVGTRKVTTYGMSVTPRVLGPLVDAGIVIASGLAYGVDALAHKQATEKGRPTIAVLGGGVDDKTLYPKNHLLLAEEILTAGGCLISEYPPGTPPFKQNFVARDRIIAGLGLGTLIVECSLKSGSLITAQYALEQNRRLYAVPGPIYAEESRGPNNLIKMGASLVTEAADILNDLNLSPKLETTPLAKDYSPTEQAVLAILTSEPMTVDAIIQNSDTDASGVTTTLTFLEMKGAIKNVGGQQYIRVR
ncbi:MAG: DNA-protecting protein DprA [Candidatus Doudnabacteria bacterium]|nr:DNA-protecting protein DprA [Candidatus Doudnabacteria bacterium]